MNTELLNILMAVYIGQRLFRDQAAKDEPFSMIEDMFDYLSEVSSPANFVNKYLAPGHYKFERGQWVNTIADDHRQHNNGAAMYDGKKFIDLNYTYCSKGAPPLCVITEFPINKWTACTASNIVFANLAAAKILSVETKICGKYVTANIHFKYGCNYQLIVFSRRGFDTNKLFDGLNAFHLHIDAHYSHDYKFDPERTLFYIDQH